jgi:hypothetical protein
MIPIEYDETLDLYDLMVVLSEELFGAGWMQDLEYRLWVEVAGDPYRFDNRDHLLDQASIDWLKKLSDTEGGWMSYTGDSSPEPALISMETWLPMYKAWLQKKGRK